MMKKIFVGNCELKAPDSEVAGVYVERDGELFYRISNYDGMQ